jgi:multidrug efflux pump subunit AcrA (membrane-fusion protein)
LRAPFDGVVIEKHLSLGEAVKEDAAVFTMSDLGQVWAEINVPAKDLPLVRVGEKVTIKATAFDASAKAPSLRWRADRRTDPHGQSPRGLGQPQGRVASRPVRQCGSVSRGLTCL